MARARASLISLKVRQEVLHVTECPPLCRADSTSVHQRLCHNAFVIVANLVTCDTISLNEFHKYVAKYEVSLESFELAVIISKVVWFSVNSYLYG